MMNPISEIDVFDSLPFSAAVLDGSGEILAVNREWRAFGAQRSASAEVATGVGFNYLDICDRATGQFAMYAKLAVEGIRQVIHGERGSFEMEYACHSPTAQMWALLQVFSIGENSGQYAIFHIPITSSMQKVEEVIQEQKLSSLGLLAGGIAHDINNLLQIVFSQLSLCRAKLASEPVAHNHLEKAYNGLNHVKNLAAQMQIYGGQSNSLQRPVDANELIKDNLSLLQASIGVTNAIIKINLSDDIGSIFGTEDGLLQIILNLLINASDAISESSGSRIDLSTERITLSTGDSIVDVYTQSTLAVGDYLRILVEDDSSGIPESMVKSIFDPYFTTKSGTRGLGLSVVMGIVRSFNGAVQVDSRVDVGTKFSVYIPIYEDLKEANINSEIASATSAQGEVILIIDDNKDVVESIQAILESVGAETICLTSGNDLDSVLDPLMKTGKMPTVAMLDLVIPGEDPEQIFLRLRELHPTIGVILISGFNQAHLAQNIIDSAEKTCFLHKPFEINQILDAIHMLHGSS